MKKAPKKERTAPALSATEHFKNGIEGFKKGDFPAAAVSFSSAASMDPRNAKYWSYLALSLTKLSDRIQDAESALLKAAALEPNNADHYANLGMICVMKGNSKAARERFQKAMSLDPGNTKAAKGLEKLKK
jgi:Flp pilus assembly protein TadD